MENEWPKVYIDDIKAKAKGAIAIGPFGSRMKSDCYVESGIPVIRGKNITGGPSFEGEFVYITEGKADTLGSSNVFQHDLVFPHRGSIGEVGIVLEDKRYVLSSSLMKLTCDREQVHPNYLYYFFKSHLGKHELLRNASQVGTPGIGQPLSSLKSIGLILPPLPEQKAIAHILGSLDDKIEINRQINTTLEAMAQALFKSWFVDFDPVIDKALAAGNPIPEPLHKRAEARKALGERRKALPADIAQHFPDRFVFNEEMGWVPEGWGVMPLSQAININPRVPLKKGVIAKYVDMKALPTSGYSIDVVIEKEYSGGAKYENGDVLLARITPCLENGKTGIVDFLKENEIGFGSTEFVVLRGKDTIKTPFIAALSRDEVFRQHCTTSMVGSSGRQRVQKSAFDSYFLCTPDKDVILNEYHRLCSVKFDMITVRKNEINSLATLRDTLLPKLLSGQLRIPDAEKIMNDA